MKAESARYFIGFSALSFCWSCGKWLSWYPAGTNESSTRQGPMTKTTLLFVCGDIHHQSAGFVIMDVTREKITARFFGWRHGTDPVEAIETLEPHFVFEVPNRTFTQVLPLPEIFYPGLFHL